MSIVEDLDRRLDEASERIAKLTGTCPCCGWNKETEPPSGQEPPIVRGALDAQAKAETRLHDYNARAEKLAYYLKIYCHAETNDNALPAPIRAGAREALEQHEARCQK